MCCNYSVPGDYFLGAVDFYAYVNILKYLRVFVDAII